MHRYEVMVILDPNLEDRTVKPSIEKFLDVVTKDGGKVEELAVWGRRHLSYPIQKHSEGIYVVLNLNCSSASVLELDRQLRLNEAVLRTKVLRAEEAVFQISQSDSSARTSEPRAASKPPTRSAAKSPARADSKPAGSKASSAKSAPRKGA